VEWPTEIWFPAQSNGDREVAQLENHPTVTIRDQKLKVERGLIGTATCEIRADAATWLGFLRKERSIVWAIIRRRVRVRRGISWLTRFGKCFPS
jgi:ribosomal protein L15E